MAIPSWAVYGSAEVIIPPAAMAFMAERARSTATIVEGAPHVVMVSQPRPGSRGHRGGCRSPLRVGGLMVRSRPAMLSGAFEPERVD